MRHPPEDSAGGKLLQNDRPSLVPRLYWIVFLGAALLVPALVAARAFLNFRSQYYILYVEGAWLALASDFSHGILYRPLFGPLGYGGTRFFPLYFVLTALIAKFHLSLESSALILSSTCVALLACAAGGRYRFLARDLTVRVGGRH
jgi:hypothetical protein